MAKSSEKNVYEIEFTKRDDEIKRLELMRADIEEELEETMKAFVKAGGDRRLKRAKRVRVTSTLLDGKSFSK